MIDRTKVPALEDLKQKEQHEEESFTAALMKFLRELFDKIFGRSCTFEEFLSETGEYFDERIRQKESRDKVKYAGGKITFTLSGDKVDMVSKLYFFNDEAEKWTVQESSNSVDKSRFKDWDTDEDLQRLSRGETVELDINPPGEN